jgi:hypothetical protein
LSIEDSCATLVSPGLDPFGDVPEPPLAHDEIGRHVGEHELNALKLDNAATGLSTLVDVRDGIFERGARDTHTHEPRRSDATC